MACLKTGKVEINLESCQDSLLLSIGHTSIPSMFRRYCFRGKKERDFQILSHLLLASIELTYFNIVQAAVSYAVGVLFRLVATFLVRLFLLNWHFNELSVATRCL